MRVGRERGRERDNLIEGLAGILDSVQEIDLEGEILDMAAVRFLDDEDPELFADMLVFLALAQPNRVAIFCPSGAGIAAEGDLSLDDEPLQVAVGVNQPTEEDDDGPEGTDASFVHVLILRE